jgi:hypothetical protein
MKAGTGKTGGDVVIPEQVANEIAQGPAPRRPIAGVRDAGDAAEAARVTEAIDAIMEQRGGEEALPETTPEQMQAKARKLLDAAKQKREQDCMIAVNNALHRFRCRLDIIEVRVNGAVQQLTVKAEALDDAG